MSAANNRSAGAASRNNRTRRNKMPHVVENNVNSRLIHRNASGREVPIAGREFHLPRAVAVPEFSLPRAVAVPEFSLPRAVSENNAANFSVPVVVENAPLFGITEIMSVLKDATDKDIYELHQLLRTRATKYQNEVLSPAQAAKYKADTKEHLRQFLSESEFNIEDYIRDKILSKKIRSITGTQLENILGKWNYGVQSDLYYLLDLEDQYKSIIGILVKEAPYISPYVGTLINPYEFNQKKVIMYMNFLTEFRRKVSETNSRFRLIREPFRVIPPAGLSLGSTNAEVSKTKSEYIADFNKLIDEDAKMTREFYSKFKESINMFLIS